EAEDGIGDWSVTGVQTCALPISENQAGRAAAAAGVGPEIFRYLPHLGCLITRFVLGLPIPTEDLEGESVLASVVGSVRALHSCRSEERRVGEEGRARGVARREEE